MPTPSDQPTRRGHSRPVTTWRIPLAYLVFSTLWVLLSSSLLGITLDDPAQQARVELLKGAGFVLVTSGLLYLLLRNRQPDPTRSPAGTEAKSSRSRLETWLLPVAILLIVPLLAYTVLTIHRPQVMATAHDNLEAIARLKAQQVTLWLEERLEDVRLFEFNEGFNERVRDLALSGDPEAARQIEARFSSMESSYQYEGTTLLDASGNILLDRGRTDAHQQQLGLQALSRRQATFSAFREDSSGDIYLDLAAPLFLPDGGQSRLTGAVVIRQYLSGHLTRLILDWPSASDSGENILVVPGPENGLVRGLSVADDGATFVTLPDSLITLLARNGTGDILLYRDRQGKMVFTIAHPIRDTGWLLLSKQDHDEIMAPIYLLIFWISLIATVAVAVSGTAALMLWRQQRHSEQLRLELEKKEADQLVERFFNLPFAGMAIATLDGKWLKFNDTFCAMLGYEHDEMRHTPPWSLTHPDELGIYGLHHERLVRGEIDLYSGESRFIHKNGSEVLARIEVSRHQPETSDEAVIYVATIDITNQKRIEQEQRIAATAFEGHHAAMFVTDPEGLFIKINNAFTRITGYDHDDVQGHSPKLLKSGRQDAEFYRQFWHALMQDHYWEGEIWNRRKNGEIYPEWLSVSAVLDRDGKAINYVGSFSDITSAKEAQNQIQWLSNFDALTGLPNLALLRDRTEQALLYAAEHGENLAMAKVDLDQFKTINDSLGFSLGDGVLVHIARRLGQVIEPTDTLSRQSGDEFTLLLPSRNQRELIELVGRVQQAVSAPFLIEDHELVLTTSVGIALFPNDGLDFDELAKAAEVAVFRAKQDGRNRYAFYEAAMQGEALRALKLGAALHRAEEDGQFQLWYQPQLDLATGRLCGAEALLRWQHPEFGWVSPAEFIPLAENNGLIVPVGEWTLRMAMRDMQTWIQAGLDQLSVAVNLSPLQFRQPNLIERIQAILAHERLPTRHLELELTESAAMDNPQHAMEVIHTLHGMGISLAIDDFGTGYSSMNYLKSFEIDKLKIDRSFIDGIDINSENQAIVLAVIRMAQALGIRVVAEGVERIEEQDFLLDSGCAMIQGYFYAKPMPAKDFLEFARSAVKT